MSDRSENTPRNGVDRRVVRPEHPENDLSDDADYANLVPPEPRDFDELADQEDPLRRAERNRQSSRQAWQYLLLSLVGTLVFGFLLALILRATSSAQECADFGGRFLCSPGRQTLWAVLASIPPVGFLIGSMVILMRKLRSYLRWRPWMGVFWVLVLFTMWVGTVTVQVGLAPTGAM